MEWVKLVAVPAYYHDGALLRAGEAAEVLFCRALAHCGSVESGGVIDKTVLPLLVPTRPQARADALVREGLWLDEGAHYRIRSWDKWQDQHDVAAEKRRKDRERQREHRRRTVAQESQPPDVTPSQPPSRDSHSDKRDGHDVDVEEEKERDREKNKTPRKRAAQPAADAPETVGQRANRIAKTFTDRVPLSNFLAVAAVVRKAIGANYDDARITAALVQLADDGRAVTTDSLRYALEGPPRRRPVGDGRASFTDEEYLADGPFTRRGGAA